MCTDEHSAACSFSYFFVVFFRRKASRLGHEKSQMRLGVYLLDRGQRTTDPQGAAMLKEAVALLNTASSQGLPDAKYVLGAYLLAVSKESSERKEALALIQAAADVIVCDSVNYWWSLCFRSGMYVAQRSWVEFY